MVYHHCIILHSLFFAKSSCWLAAMSTPMNLHKALQNFIQTLDKAVKNVLFVLSIIIIVHEGCWKIERVLRVIIIKSQLCT